MGARLRSARAKQKSWRWPSDQFAPPMNTPRGEQQQQGTRGQPARARTFNDDGLEPAVRGHDLGAQVDLVERLPDLVVGVLLEGVQVGPDSPREEHGVLRD